MAEEIVSSNALDISLMVGMMAPNKRALVEFVKSRLAPNFPIENPEAPLLYIQLHDVASRFGVRYKTVEDIPDVSVPCPCGNPKHWLIKYTGQN